MLFSTCQKVETKQSRAIFLSNFGSIPVSVKVRPTIAGWAGTYVIGIIGEVAYGTELVSKWLDSCRTFCRAGIARLQTNCRHAPRIHRTFLPGAKRELSLSHDLLRYLLLVYVQG